MWIDSTESDSIISSIFNTNTKVIFSTNPVNKNKNNT